ncbi:MAG: hypothetical protein IMY82_02675, partial [Chloroflexi bacterium]|nr:hypothetical protein [Chloroflexota bacterium]
MKHGKSVAIVGVGGIFPKSPTLEQFWANIRGNVNTAQLPPSGRWLLDPDEAYAPQIAAPDKVYSKKACFIADEIDPSALSALAIDADFLGSLDPMYRLLLRVGQMAFVDGVVEGLDRSKTGVIIGNLALPSEKSSALAREYLGRTFAEKLLGPQ